MADPNPPKTTASATTSAPAPPVTTAATTQAGGTAQPVPTTATETAPTAGPSSAPHQHPGMMPFQPMPVRQQAPMQATAAIERRTTTSTKVTSRKRVGFKIRALTHSIPKRLQRLRRRSLRLSCRDSTPPGTTGSRRAPASGRSKRRRTQPFGLRRPTRDPLSEI